MSTARATLHRGLIATWAVVGLALVAGMACAATGKSAAAAANPTTAIDAQGQLRDAALQARFERIAGELRCVVCQNESIADSNADLAGDLRRQVREMLLAGASDTAIFTFMTDRYGEFIRFRPPLETKTLFIWGAPFFMLLFGAGLVYRVASRRARMDLGDEPAVGSP